MSALPATIAEAYTQRYEALLRATNAIGTCSDCDAAADTLVKALHEVVPFDYMQLVAFESDAAPVAWHLLYSNGGRQELSLAHVVVRETPVAWVQESQQVLATTGCNGRTRFPKQKVLLIVMAAS